MSKTITASSNTPYDDVFRTLLNDCSSLIIPVINKVFGEKYHLECQSTTDKREIQKREVSKIVEKLEQME